MRTLVPLLLPALLTMAAAESGPLSMRRDDGGTPELVRDGKPFFLRGAASAENFPFLVR